MTSLYVIGGQQRSARSLLAGNQDWNGYERGLVLQVNPETGEARSCLEYVSPPEVCAEQDPAITFQASTLQDGTLYTCTQTELLVYDVPSFKQKAYITLPCFNDVHHVRPSPDGHLLVANAGLEMVMEVTLAGEIRRVWNVLGEDPWARVSREVDYRRISTKPHRSHPNYVFCIGEEIWATRFHQGDAVSLTRPGRSMHVSDKRIHDGVLHQGYVYFTSVDGSVVVVNADTLQIEQLIDLNSMHAEGTLLGWCRSLLIDGDLLWAGFSRIRPTKFRENVSWMVRGFKRGMPTHVVCYDLRRRRCITEIDLEVAGLGAIYGIFPAVE
ncbi:MAG TPA: hypothetical protein VFU22_02880 [Roseiflexaceae bacterium]|nr:hypothetical protein [Roseiflexaceae bacterium]